MEVIKQEYTRPKPILYLYRGMPETSLVSNDFDTAKEITLSTNINEVATLTFSIPFTVNRKISYDDCEKLVKFEGEYYIIKNIQIEDNTTGSIKVTCQHESTELKGVYCFYMDLIGASPSDMFTTIVNSTMHPIDVGYKWAGTDVDPTKKRHLTTENEASVYQNLVSMAEVFNGWLEFYTDVNEQKWVYLRCNPIDNGKFIKKNLDMKALNITYTSEEIFTRLYPLGASDEITGEELNIMSVNPTKKSYVENYSYYLAKGIPTSVVDKEAKYQQLKTMRDDTYTDETELYKYALEELAKCSVPQLDATLDMEDLSVYINSLDTPPIIGYKMTVINQDIDFILGCQITGVERNYDNPLETKVTISNVIRYDTVYQNIQHSSNSTDKVTTDNGNGTIVPGTSVIVKGDTGDHLNVQMALNGQSSIITQQAGKIELLVQDVNGAKASITMQANQIQNLVQDVAGNKSLITQQAGQITTLVSRVDGAYSQIQQNATAISQKVSNGDFQTFQNQTAYNFSQTVSNGTFNTYKDQTAYQISQKVSAGQIGTLIEQNADSICFAIQNKTNSNVVINSRGMTINGGGLVINDGGQCMWFDNGIAKAKVLSCDELIVNNTGTGSEFFNVLSNMPRVSMGKVDIWGRLGINSDDFYISYNGDMGWNLYEFIWKTIQDYADEHGW